MYFFDLTVGKTSERKKVRNRIVSNSSESGEEDLVVKATEKKVRNCIISDSSESED